MAPEFMDPASGVFSDRAFHELLSREVGRATRYQDFFSLCLVKPHVGPGGGDQTEPIEHAVSRKIAQFLRATDIVGLTQHGMAILLLNTPDTEAVRIADRILAHIETVFFQIKAGEPPLRVTLSAGLVSFPRDGSNETVLLTRAQSLLGEAAHSGGNRVARPK